MNWVIESFDIVLRALMSVVALFILTRILGAKQISQMSFFDYAIGISIGSIAAEMTVDRELPYHYAIIAMLVFSLAALFISFWTDKSIWARRLFVGTPILLVQNGKIIEKNLKHAKMDLNELLGECRMQGYFNLADIKYAVMETNGKLSLLPKEEKKNVTCGDLGISPAVEGLVANVIIDGKIMKRNLKAAGKNDDWLKAELKKQKYNAVSEVFLATVDSAGALTVYRKGVQGARATVFD